jgi:hypothetical protein
LSKNKKARKPSNIYRQNVGIRKLAGDTSLGTFGSELYLLEALEQSLLHHFLINFINNYTALAFMSNLFFTKMEWKLK